MPVHTREWLFVVTGIMEIPHLQTCRSYLLTGTLHSVALNVRYTVDSRTPETCMTSGV